MNPENTLNNLGLPPIFSSLGAAEREYFLSLARRYQRELALHKEPGMLWEKDENGKDWSNVTEHCLMEAARAGALAELLGFSDAIKDQLISAALVHDFNKKEEICLTQKDIGKGGSGRGGALASEEKSEKILQEHGFSSLVVSLVAHVPGDFEDIVFMKNILDTPNCAEEDLARLVLHYIDGYTRGGAWVEPADHKRRMNDIDRRNRMNAANPNYQAMNQEGLMLNAAHPFFRGLTGFEAAAAVGHLIEQRFFEIMKRRGIAIEDPFDIPELVDVRVKNAIEKNRGL